MITPTEVNAMVFSIILVSIQAVWFFVFLPRTVWMLKKVAFRLPTMPVCAYLACDFLIRVAADFNLINRDWSEVFIMTIVIALALLIASEVRPR